jgi:hypothetical protein
LIQQFQWKFNYIRSFTIIVLRLYQYMFCRPDEKCIYTEDEVRGWYRDVQKVFGHCKFLPRSDIVKFSLKLLNQWFIYLLQSTIIITSRRWRLYLNTCSHSRCMWEFIWSDVLLFCFVFYFYFTSVFCTSVLWFFSTIYLLINILYSFINRQTQICMKKTEANISFFDNLPELNNASSFHRAYYQLI